MRRILLVLAVAALMAAMVVAMAVPAFAQTDPNCRAQSTSNAEPGEVGETSRFFAENYGKDFGQATKFTAQFPAVGCGLAGDGGPPGAYDPDDPTL